MSTCGALPNCRNTTTTKIRASLVITVAVWMWSYWNCQQWLLATNKIINDRRCRRLNPSRSDARSPWIVFKIKTIVKSVRVLVSRLSFFLIATAEQQRFKTVRSQRLPLSAESNWTYRLAYLFLTLTSSCFVVCGWCVRHVQEEGSREKESVGMGRKYSPKQHRIRPYTQSISHRAI